MNLDLVLIADMANIDAVGKFNIVGEFNAVLSPKLPARPPAITLVARIVAATPEGKKHKVGIALIDADGNQIARIPDQDVEFSSTIPGSTGDLRAQLVLTIAGAQFDHYGAYQFHILVDGRSIGERTFHVVQPPKRRKQRKN